MKTQKSVLFMVRLFYPHIGGVEKHVLEISKILVKKGYRVTIICEKTPGRFKKIKGIELFQIPIKTSEGQKKYMIWKWLFDHRDLISKADIIHCHDVFFWYLPFRFIYPLKPIFTTFHGYESYPIRKEAKAARKMAQALSNGTISVGAFMKKWYGTLSDFTIYGACEKIKVYPIPSKPSALFVGRLDEQTGILEYDKAIKQVKRKIPGFSFTVAGDGFFRKQLETKPKFLGFIKNPQKLYRKSRYAFVSRYLSILEALASKRLVFALYDNPLKKDYLLKTPFNKFIITAGDSEELVGKIIHFIKYPKQEQELVEKGYRWAKAQTWEEVVRVYIKLWEKRNSLASFKLFENTDFLQ